MFFWLYGAVTVLLCVILFWLRDRWHHSIRVPNLHKKCVFVTGCDSGFGFETAVRLDGKGIKVFAGCLTPEGAKKLQKKCSIRLQTLPLDVTKPEDIQGAFDTVSSNIPDGSELWGVVNNAGVMCPEGPTEFHTRSDYLRLMEINFLGLVEVVQTFLPLLKKSRGRIVNMGSISGVSIIPRLAPYVASKAAVVAFSNALRMEQSIWGVHVSVVLPGGFGTNIVTEEIYRKNKEKQWNNLTPELQEAHGRQQFDRAIETWVNWKDNAPTNFSPVVDAYENALLSQNPRSHYITDHQAWALYIINMLPRRWADSILIKQLVTHEVYMPQSLTKKSI